MRKLFEVYLSNDTQFNLLRWVNSIRGIERDVSLQNSKDRPFKFSKLLRSNNPSLPPSEISLIHS